VDDAPWAHERPDTSLFSLASGRVDILNLLRLLNWLWRPFERRVVCNNFWAQTCIEWVRMEPFNFRSLQRLPSIHNIINHTFWRVQIFFTSFVIWDVWHVEDVSVIYGAAITIWFLQIHSMMLSISPISCFKLLVHKWW
jgi:hypothetical protein